LAGIPADAHVHPAPWPWLAALRRHARLILFLVGLFAWVDLVPLYGPLGAAWAAARHVAYGPLPLWFLAAHGVGLILFGHLWDRFPRFAVAGARSSVLADAVLTVLLLWLPAGAWPAAFAVMGLATAAAMPAWGRWYATTVRVAWWGRVFALAAAGIEGVNFLYDPAGRYLTAGTALLAVLATLALAWAALGRFDTAPDPDRTEPPAYQSLRQHVQSFARFALFIVLFSLLAGMSYNFLFLKPLTPFADESLRRLPYIVGVLAAGWMVDRRNLQSAMVAGAGLLALAYLVGAWRAQPEQVAGTIMNGGAFGLLEAAPWLLLAGNAGPRDAARWFGWGLNLNVVPIFIGALIPAQLPGMTPAHLGLIAAVVLLLAILSLHGAVDPIALRRLRGGRAGPARHAPGAALPRPAQPPRGRGRAAGRARGSQPRDRGPALLI